MKIELLDLAFTAKHFYLQKESIIEKIIFNNRTFYSKFEKQVSDITTTLFQQHQKHEVVLAIPLIYNNKIEYIVIEYTQEDWKAFYSLVKHLLKSLDINECYAFYNEKKKLFQLFIPQFNTDLEDVYKEVENIKHHLECKSKKSYKIYPNPNLPQNFNIITLPTQKI